MQAVQFEENPPGLARLVHAALDGIPTNKKMIRRTWCVFTPNKRRTQLPTCTYSVDFVSAHSMSRKFGTNARGSSPTPWFYCNSEVLSVLLTTLDAIKQHRHRYPTATRTAGLATYHLLRQVSLRKWPAPDWSFFSAGR